MYDLPTEQQNRTQQNRLEQQNKTTEQNRSDQQNRTEQLISDKNRFSTSRFSVEI